MAIAYQPQSPPKVRFEWIKEAYRLYQDQAATWTVCMLIFLAVNIVLWAGLFWASGMLAAVLAHGGFGANVPNANPLAYLKNPLYWGMYILDTVVPAYFVVGLIRMANAQVRGEAISPAMMFQVRGVYWQFLAYEGLLSLIDLVGSVAGDIGHVPGYLLSWLLDLASYVFLVPGLVLVAEGVPFAEALRRSISVMSKNWLSATLFVLLLAMWCILALLPCGLGLFVFFPTQFLILPLIYRDMFAMSAGEQVTGAYAQYGPLQPGVWPPPPVISSQDPGAKSSSESPKDSVSPPISEHDSSVDTD